MFALWLKENLALARAVLLCVSSLPAWGLLYAWWTQSLGPNPLATLTNVTGITALYFLILSLSITPLRRWMSLTAQRFRWRYGKRISDWNPLVRCRRQLGLWCFFYALVHGWVYWEFEALRSAPFALMSIREKPYLQLGAFALGLLVPLAATSFTAVMRRMGKNWIRLHRSTYLAGILAVMHFALQSKAGTYPYLLEAALLMLLLGYRLLLMLGWMKKWSGSDGLESPER